MIDKLLAVVAGCLIVWAIVRSRYPIRVTLTRDGVMKSKNLPNAIRIRLHRFARDNLAAGDVVTLKGQFIHRGRIRWVFPRNGDPDFAQRLRNFMVNEVYL